MDLELFVDKLIEEKGLESLDDEVLTQMKKDLMLRLEQRIDAVMIAALPPEKLEEAEKMVNGGEEKEIAAYFHKNIPDLDQVVAGALMGFREIYLG